MSLLPSEAPTYMAQTSIEFADDLSNAQKRLE
jgi:hypothetical protein